MWLENLESPLIPPSNFYQATNTFIDAVNSVFWVCFFTFFRQIISVYGKKSFDLMKPLKRLWEYPVVPSPHCVNHCF